MRTDPGEGRKRQRDSRVETSDDGEKGCGESEEGHGGRTEPAGGGKTSAGLTAVETTADAKQATRRRQVGFWKRFIEFIQLC